MIEIIQLIVFIKVFILFMSILNIIKEAFKLYKSLKIKEKFIIPNGGLLLLGLSISYVLTMIFV